MNTKNSKKIGRNDLCPCGSGKKYKRCCIPSNQANKIENENKHVANIMPELKYKITEEPIDDDVRQLPEEVQSKMEDLYHKLHVNPKGCIDDLKDLVNKYPHIPQFYNFLYASYAQAGQIIKANDVMKENYKKNPTYLFALLNYAEYLINNDNLDKVNKVFESKFDLALLYPDRDTFHVTEVVNFHGVVGLYYALLGEESKARHCLNILKVVSPKDFQTLRLAEKLGDNYNFIA